MGDFNAFATAAHVGRGLPLFNQCLIMAVIQSSTFSLADALMASSVPGEVPSSNPMLYHFDLDSQTAFWTPRRSSMLRKPDDHMAGHNVICSVFSGRPYQ